MAVARRTMPLLLAATLAAVSAAAAHGEGRMDEARGRFEVDVQPASHEGAPVTRMTLKKRWAGDIQGDSVGEMLSYGSPASGNAGYVAMERVTGSVKGRQGSFAIQQSGTMDAGAPSLTATVVPGSGTGALTGLAGSMTIDPAAGHAYVLSYTLAGAPVR